MPKPNQTMLDQLRQYYKTAPRPVSEFGDDVFNFAADRIGRHNRALRDLEDLDRYAMKQQARGRYNPDELNAVARQIEANRMLSEMDFNEFMEPRYKRYRAYAEAEANRIHGMANRAMYDADRMTWDPSEEELRPYYTGVADDALDAYFDTRNPQYLVDWENANLAPMNYKRFVNPGYREWVSNPGTSKIMPLQEWYSRSRRFENDRGDAISPADWRESIRNERYR